jgi:hypothetical protein
MANNFKSKEVTYTTSGTQSLLTCSVTSIIVSSITFQVEDGDTASASDLLFSKDGGTTRSIKKIKTLSGGSAVEFLDRSFVMNDNDQLQLSVTSLSGTAVATIHYLEKTASAASGNLGDLDNVSAATPSDNYVLAWDAATSQWAPQSIESSDITGASTTADLPQQSTGSEPFNRYMKGFNALDQLTNAAAETAAEALYGSPASIKFVAENTDLSTIKPMKVTFQDIIQAIIEVGANDLAADPSNDYDINTFTGSGGVGDLNGDGVVSVADLLEFLITFGQAWGSSSSNLFNPSTIEFTDSDAHQIGTNITTITFSSGDVTVVDAGTQTITVDNTNDLVEITSLNSTLDLTLVPSKEITFSSYANSAAYVSTTQANQTIVLWAYIRLYDSSSVQLGTTAQIFLGNKTFAQAQAGQVWETFNPVTVINSTILSGTGHTSGWNNSNVDKYDIRLAAQTNGGGATIQLDNVRVKMTSGQYTPEI